MGDSEQVCGVEEGGKCWKNVKKNNVGRCGCCDEQKAPRTKDRVARLTGAECVCVTIGEEKRPWRGKAREEQVGGGWGGRALCMALVSRGRSHHFASVAVRCWRSRVGKKTGAVFHCCRQRDGGGGLKGEAVSRVDGVY